LFARSRPPPATLSVPSPPLFRSADDRLQPPASARDGRLARRPHRRERDHLDLRAGKLRLRDRLPGDACEESLQPVVIGVMQVIRSEEHTSELQSLTNLVCRLLLQ